MLSLPSCPLCPLDQIITHGSILPKGYDNIPGRLQAWVIRYVIPKPNVGDRPGQDLIEAGRNKRSDFPSRAPGRGFSRPTRIRCGGGGEPF